MIKEQMHITLSCDCEECQRRPKPKERTFVGKDKDKVYRQIDTSSKWKYFKDMKKSYAPGHKAETFIEYRYVDGSPEIYFKNKWINFYQLQNTEQAKRAGLNYQVLQSRFLLGKRTEKELFGPKQTHMKIEYEGCTVAQIEALENGTPLPEPTKNRFIKGYKNN